MTDAEWHRNRARAESFGAGAADYDRYRPPYADGLFDELAALRPDRVLDVGCGNGRAAVGFVARGLPVLGVEPDARMAEVARSHGVEVEIAPFEDWEDDGRRFGLLTCGSAWHWVEPARGVAKAATVLRPGGTLARFWNYHVFSDATVERLDRVYADLGIDAGAGLGRRAEAFADDPVAADPAFGEVTELIWREERAFTADGWIDLLGTFSDHATLEAGRRGELFAALRSVIDEIGGTLRATACTHQFRCART